MNLSFTILVLSSFIYLIAFLSHLVSFLGVNEKGHRPAFTLLRIGFLLSTFYFMAEAVEHQSFLPVANLSQAMAFFAWSLAFVYLVLLARAQSESFGLILTPILLLLMGIACLSFHIQSQPLSVALNPFFTVHIVCAYFAYASFTISFAAGILYLIQYHELKSKHAGQFYHKLPSLEELEKLIYQPMIWGAFLLVAAVGIGFMWSKSAYGEFWIWDPKTIATSVTAIFYFVILYLRYVSALRGKQIAVLSLAAFAVVLFSFVGTRFIGGSHNFLQ